MASTHWGRLVEIASCIFGGAGNTHACAFYSRREPDVLYINSHRKPITLAIRRIEADGAAPRQELMVASDVNAALMLWPGPQVDAAAGRISALQELVAGGGPHGEEARREMEALLDRFTPDVIFLDSDLHGGEELLACINQRVIHGVVVPEICVTRYDGTPVVVAPQPVRLNPAMVGRRGYATYTESHIAEIPDVLDDIVETHLPDGEVHLDSLWREGTLFRSGLNVADLRVRYGSHLERLDRLLLIGEGSSWRDARAAAPLFRDLLPGVLVIVHRPVEVLNAGEAIDSAHDLAVEISWSGTTDSLLKVDDLLAELGAMRLGVTGRPQSDLGRRTATSAGTLDVRSGVEVSVVTVKGYAAILATLDLVALQLARISGGEAAAYPQTLARLTDKLVLVLPSHVRAVVQDPDRRARLREVAQRCRGFNKVAVVGGSPVDVEGELKIEEMAWIVAKDFEFHDVSLRPLIERSAIVDDDRRRTLFIVNATTPERAQEAGPIINYLHGRVLYHSHHPAPRPGRLAGDLQRRGLRLPPAIPSAPAFDRRPLLF